MGEILLKDRIDASRAICYKNQHAAGQAGYGPRTCVRIENSTILDYAGRRSTVRAEPREFPLKGSMRSPGEELWAPTSLFSVDADLHAMGNRHVRPAFASNRTADVELQEDGAHANPSMSRTASQSATRSAFPRFESYQAASASL